MIRFASAGTAGDFGMATPKDIWPLPEYNPGPRDHLHAVGVISMGYVSLEQSIGRLYQHYPVLQGLPTDLVNLYYFRLDERHRLKAVKSMFNKYEKDERVRAVIESLVDYFQWCWEVRNALLHSQLYPALFAKKDKLYLAKPAGKQQLETKYLALDLTALRGIADRIRIGQIRTSATILYLRYRDIPTDRLPLTLRARAPEPLPEILERPPPLELSDRPENLPEHIFLRLPPLLKL